MEQEYYTDTLSKNEQFYFDDFFISENEPIRHLLLIKGKMVPFKFKRSFSLDDIQSAQSRAIKMRMNPLTKQMELDSIDHATFMQELVPRAIVEWPLTDRTGKKIPINKDTCGQLLLTTAMPIMKIVEQMTQDIEAGQDTSFFENRSDVALLKKDQEKFLLHQGRSPLESHVTKNTAGRRKRSENYHIAKR